MAHLPRLEISIAFVTFVRAVRLQRSVGLCCLESPGCFDFLCRTLTAWPRHRVGGRPVHTPQPQVFNGFVVYDEGLW